MPQSMLRQIWYVPTLNRMCRPWGDAEEEDETVDASLDSVVAVADMGGRKFTTTVQVGRNALPFQPRNKQPPTSGFRQVRRVHRTMPSYECRILHVLRDVRLDVNLKVLWTRLSPASRHSKFCCPDPSRLVLNYPPCRAPAAQSNSLR